MVKITFTDLTQVLLHILSSAKQLIWRRRHSKRIFKQAALCKYGERT